MKSEKIGTITITEPLDTRIDYETAAWYAIVRIEPGTYDVMGYQYYPNGNVEISGMDAEGICVEDHTPSLYGGVPIGGPKSSTSEGRRMRAGWAGGLKIDLDPGFKWQERECSGRIYHVIRRVEPDDSLIPSAGQSAGIQPK